MIDRESCLKLAIAGMAAVLTAQTTGAKLETVSVKPCPPGNPGYPSASPSPGRLALERYPLRDLIQAAYGLSSFQLAGGPAWIETARYEITAKADRPVGTPEMWGLMRTVLADRFHLRTHVEKRELPVYELTVAKPGRLAPPRGGNCAAGDSRGAPTEPKPGARLLAPCGALLMPVLADGAAGLYGGGITMPRLATRLASILGRPVVDKTGFTHAFDMDIEFAFRDPRALPAGRDPLEQADASGKPTLAGALRDKLGLRLAASKGPVDVRVIDHIERPSPN